MSTSAILLLLIVGPFFVWGLAFGSCLPKPYRARSCQGRSWRKKFPAESKNEIRAFLSLFVSAFAIKDCEKLKLAPTDEILKIYRARHSSLLQSDVMEIETLAQNLKRQHGLSLETPWNENLTLGELFSHIVERRGKRDDA